MVEMSLADTPPAEIPPRLVSKQIQQEYDDEVLRIAVLAINDCDAVLSWNGIKNTAPDSQKGHFKLLDVVQNVTLRYNVSFIYQRFLTIKDIQGAVDSVKGWVGELAQDMLPQSVLRVELTLDVMSTDLLKKETWDSQSFFNMASATGMRSDIHLSSHLFIKHRMFSAHPDLQGLDQLAEYMDCSTENKIVYEAKPSSSEDNWHGLDLATFTSGTWDYESIVAKAKVFRSTDLINEDPLSEYSDSEDSYAEYGYYGEYDRYDDLGENDELGYSDSEGGSEDGEDDGENDGAD
ncbi:hypothetical protein LTR17_013031 [Elasticomyces elasticus]|nr:hypothetical protein LTR17_013031 [Elasticomyces elasticus]